MTYRLCVAYLYPIFQRPICVKMRSVKFSMCHSEQEDDCKQRSRLLLPVDAGQEP
jgi:hypothetical protein